MSPHHTANDTDWFERTGRALDRAGVGEPTWVIDLDRLDQNVDALRRIMPPGVALRLVQKSLPSMALLRSLMPRLGCDRLMVFHRPWLTLYAQHMPDIDLLLGKPMPVAAARHYYAEVQASPKHPGPHWLVDTPQRLQQYLALAQSLGRRLRLCIEIDVGLHRGGAPTPPALDALLDLIAQHPSHLHWTGLMGYDAHAAKAPWWSTPAREVQRSQQRYQAFIDHARTHHAALCHEGLIFNGAGSPTIALHTQAPGLNELAAGSALLKPTDFDVPSLQAFCPAVLLAAPVLKASNQLEVPYVTPLSRWLGRHLSQRAQSICLYGGRYMARPVWPPGLRDLPLVGGSSNQQLMTLPASPALQADDWTYWRPTQSEQVLLQHGDLLGMRGDEIVARFPVDPVAGTNVAVSPDA
jgi:D-serine deaminase-like pyridoxal phosphate-dependent protein